MDICKCNRNVFVQSHRFFVLSKRHNPLHEFLKKDINLKLIDDYKINGDFIESQAFAFLAIRSFKELPISFPGTTGCKKACTGGELIKN